MGRGKAAIVDLERVLELKPDFYGVSLELFWITESFINFPLFA